MTGQFISSAPSVSRIAQLCAQCCMDLLMLIDNAIVDNVCKENIWFALVQSGFTWRGVPNNTHSHITVVP
jgi:hypothetical protein